MRERAPQGWSDRSRTHDPATRARALELSDLRSPTEASRELGVPVGTIRRWRHEDGRVEPPRGADIGEWAASKDRGAREAWDAAQQALAKVRQLIAEDRPADAQRAALTMAILTDKSGVMEEASARLERRQKTLAEEQAKLLSEILIRFLADLGVPTTQPMGQVLAHYLRQAEAVGEITDPASAVDIAAARSDLREGVSQTSREENRYQHQSDNDDADTEPEKC